MTSQVGRACAEDLLNVVDLPQPFDVAEFCRRLANHRGRPIRLISEHGATVSGTLIGTSDVDEIHFSADTSEYHQWGIILHEIGHLLMGHGLGVIPSELLGAHWNPGRIRQVAARHQYDSGAEQAAEDFATTVLERVGELPLSGDQPNNDEAQEERRRLRAMFLG